MRILKEYKWVIVGAVFTLSITALAVLLYKAYETHKQDTATILALNATVKIVRNENQSQTATIAAFKADKVKDITKLQSKDSTIQWLQSVLNKNQKQIDAGGSAVVFSTSSKVDVVSPTEIQWGPEEDSTNYISLSEWPTYFSEVHLGKWLNGSILATKDTTFAWLKTYNEYEVVVGEEGNIFKGYTPYAQITTLSPYDSIRTMRGYIKSYPKPKRFSIGIQAGYGYNLINLSRTFYVGVGVGFNLINIK